jgi:hypothetical protein
MKRVAGGWVAMACMAALLAAAPPAGAVTITLGPADLAASDPFAECDIACTTRVFVPTAVPGATLVTPADGTIVSWRVKGAPPKRLRLRVLRAAGGGRFTGVDTSGIATQSDGSGSIPAALDVNAGDQLGIELETNYPSLEPSVLLGDSSFPGATWSGFTPGLADGETATPTESGSGAVPLFNATVELFEPQILQMTSSAGPASGGEAVVLTGRHLAVATGVKFGSVPAQVLKADGNQVIAVSPPHAPGVVEVTVETAGGSSADSIADRYEYLPAAAPDAGPDVAPALWALRLSPKAFAAKRRGPSAVAASAAGASAAAGAIVSFRSSEPARVRFTLQRRVGSRYLRLRGSFRRGAVPGLNAFRFTGRLRGKALPAGSYRLLARSVDAGGKASKPVRRSFRIVP